MLPIAKFVITICAAIFLDRIGTCIIRIVIIEVLSAIKTFVLEVLPENATPEQIAFATKTMEQPKQEKLPPSVTHNHYVTLSGNDATYNENTEK